MSPDRRRRVGESGNVPALLRASDRPYTAHYGAMMTFNACVLAASPNVR